MGGPAQADPQRDPMDKLQTRILSINHNCHPAQLFKISGQRRHEIARILCVTGTKERSIHAVGCRGRMWGRACFSSSTAKKEQRELFNHALAFS